MPLSEQNNKWNKKALEVAATRRKFIQEAVKAGFTEQQAEFLFIKNEKLVDRLY